VGEDLIHREISISFFNGYGTELNMFRPGGRNDDYRADLGYLARTTFILRQNNDAFLDQNWTPLIETSADNIFVNRWRSGEKTIYTVLNLHPEGYSGKLFKVPGQKGKHYVYHYGTTRTWFPKMIMAYCPFLSGLKAGLLPGRGPGGKDLLNA